ncbi:MAG TPA: SDR family oxidoreductase [Novosphingobium sp.]|nr:SDR family oxidoreductase [Novosphingobium sp.]
MDLSNRLSGKVGIITGGAGGLGSRTCRRLVAEGARVVVADIRGDAAKALADELGPSASSFEFDYLNEGSIKDLVADTIGRCGRIDLLHNNAIGGTGGRDGAILNADPEVWDLSYALNVRGYMLASKHVLPHMIAQKTGVIVNMSSGAALGGGLQLSAYGVMKAAVMTLTQYIATQYGKDGVRSTSITPGVTQGTSTERMSAEGLAIQKRHALTPEFGDANEIAAVVAFLASDESKFITGSNIRVDGGLFSHNPTVADLREQAPART